MRGRGYLERSGRVLLPLTIGVWLTWGSAASALVTVIPAGGACTLTSQCATACCCETALTDAQEGTGGTCQTPAACASNRCIESEGGAYGGRAGGRVLLPWFISGPGADVDTLIAIIHDDTRSSEFLHVMLFDVDSTLRCGACVPLSSSDVYTANIRELVKSSCLPGDKAALDAGDKPPNKLDDGPVLGAPPDGVKDRLVGYALFEPSTNSSCSDVKTEQDLVPHFYQVQLGTGLAAGLDGPVYEDKPGVVPRARDFDKYALFKDQVLFFRILVGLGGDNSRAQTQLIVWSDTSGACGPNTPDAACLSRPGLPSPFSSTRVCDENEVCTSQSPPLFDHEVNIRLADDFVPVAFPPGGGWLAWFSEPTGNNIALNVLGYADNRANNGGNTANSLLNWRAIFPAQRGKTLP